MPHLKNLAAAPAMLAALSFIATPANAADMSMSSPAKSNIAKFLDVEASQTAEHHRRHRYRYHRGPGIGDVVAGVLIVGAIAHVARRATEDRRDRDYPDRDYRRDVRWSDGRGLDRVVGMCIEAVERQARVETVDSANRTARGWSVEGTLARGGSFDCEIDNDVRGVEVNLGSDYDRRDRGGDFDNERDEGIDYDRHGRYGDYDIEPDDDQWDDDRYSSEWSKVDRGEVAAETAQAPTAPYPGGALDADDVEVDGDLEIGTGYPGAGV